MGYCSWADVNELNKTYHDNEWGIPVRDDRLMFEHLSLECLQCGLSWDLMLKKRDIFRNCFDNFDYNKIAEYNESDANKILNTEGMLRSINKVNAIINNAKCSLKIKEEYGSLCNYFWSFSNNKTIIYNGHKESKIPVSNGLSKKISKDLKKRGFKFVGSITIYSHLQACGIINDHSEDCHIFEMINKKYPVIKLKPDNEIF